MEGLNELDEKAIPVVHHRKDISSRPHEVMGGDTDAEVLCIEAGVDAAVGRVVLKLLRGELCSDGEEEARARERGKGE